MRPEITENIGLGGNFHEIHPEINHFPLAGEQKSGIKSEIAIADDARRFEIMAKTAVDSEKIVNIKESNDSSVIFQQDRIKDILDIIKNNPENSAEEIKRYWEEYDDMVKKYAGEYKTELEKDKIFKYFTGIERSVVGSLAVIKFFKEKGFAADFPTTKNDRFGKCDLIFHKKDKNGADYNLAVQLKSCTIDGMKHPEKEWEKKLKNAISINKFTLDKKDELEFERLKAFCDNLHKESGKFYFPVFIKIPVDMERLVSKKGESKTLKLIDGKGVF